MMQLLTADDNYVTIYMQKTEFSKGVSNIVIQLVKENRPLTVVIRRSHSLSIIVRTVKVKAAFVS
jgi:hypothetical protein